MKKVTGAIFLIFIIVGFLVFLVLKKMDENDFNAKINGGCKIDQDYVTVILIDDTDRIDFQGQGAKSLVQRTAEEAPRFSRFVIYRLSDLTVRGIRPVTERCNPFGKNDKADKWTENENELKRAKNAFRKEIAEVTNKLLDIKEKNRSPIMEAVYSVAVSEFDRLKSDAEKRLIIISDMMQNTDDFSMFSKNITLDFNLFKRRPYYKRMATDALNDVHVSVFMINKDRRQTEELKDFWIDYFKDQGASVKFIR
ncbi:MAG: hypothetical protein J5781_04220 [Clostridia bacterium]|nr:hypothetical protein [Clostridia bacterium]